MFRDRLKELRSEKKLTQEKLADLLGLERSSVGKYEGNKGNLPSPDILQQLADFFDVSVDYLLDRSDIKKASAEKAEVTDEDIQFALFGGKVSKEAYEDVKSYAQYVKEKHKKMDNEQK